MDFVTDLKNFHHNNTEFFKDKNCISYVTKVEVVVLASLRQLTFILIYPMVTGRWEAIHKF